MSVRLSLGDLIEVEYERGDEVHVMSGIYLRRDEEFLMLKTGRKYSIIPRERIVIVRKLPGRDE